METWSERLEKLELAGLATAGYSSAEAFVGACPTEEKLEAFVRHLLVKKQIAGEILEDDLEFSPQAGALRSLWKELASEREVAEPRKHSRKAADTSDEEDDSENKAEKAEDKKKKMPMDKWLECKKTFTRSYPAEVVLPETSPSRELCATVAKMKNKAIGFYWLAWSLVFSAATESLRDQSGGKRKRDITPFEGDLSGKPDERGDLSAIRLMLELRGKAFAWSGMCHLHSWKTYTEMFMHLYQAKPQFDGERAPCLSEAITADRVAVEAAFALVQEDDWSLDDALKEVAKPRGELFQMLGPRAKSFTKETKGTKGAGKDSKKLALDADSKAIQAKCVKLPGKKKQMCFAWAFSNNCSKGDKCRFAHSCAVKKPDGKPCACADHRPSECPHLE